MPAMPSYKPTVGNSLQDVFPTISAQWNTQLNGLLIPLNICPKSNKKVWWKCELNHEWLTTVKKRTLHKQGCPYCANLKSSPQNNLQFLFPNIAAEWHPTKNTLTADQVTKGSGRYVWWLGVCGHEWQSPVYKRTTRGHGCPICCKSKGERKIYSVLVDLGALFKEQYKITECKNLYVLPFDFVIFKKDKIHLVEYHGEQHYRPTCFGNDNSSEEFSLTVKRDKIKAEYCKNNGIPLTIIPYWEFRNIKAILTETL